MLPEPNQDRSALRWIRIELDQSVREARTALEDYVDGDPSRLGVCADTLHHVHGALEMIQVYGGAMLADEMEQLARRIAGGQVQREQTAAEALMLGMVQLPAYLEKVESGGADVPLALLPLMNDLRAARDAPLVSETSLFAPKLDTVIAAETVRPGSGNRDMPCLIRQHRSQYHRGLLNWIRDHEVSASLNTIGGVLDELNAAAGTARFRRLLDTAEALAIALSEDDEAPALAVKPLFSKLDRVFKRVIDQGEEAAMLDFPVDLLKNLLYYIARSNSTNPAVMSVKQAADLVNSFPDAAQGVASVGTLGAPGREMFDAVGEALGNDLRDVKDQLDLYIRGDRDQLDRLTGLAAPIQRIADTLGMVGRGELRTRLKHHCDALAAAKASSEPLLDDHLMALASDLLFVESALSSLDVASHDSVVDEDSDEGTPSQLLSRGEMRQHMHAAIDESLVEVAKIKDEILAYLEQPDQRALLDEVPARVHRVAGAMRMLDMPDPGRLLDDLGPYISRLSAGEHEPPDTIQRDALADVVMSAELYMHSAVEPGADRGHLLAYAEEAAALLGLGSSDTSRDEAVLDTSSDCPQSDTADEAHEASAEASDIAEVETDEQTPAEPVPSDAADSADVDSEILEIFAEEAAEELEVIQRCIPQWRADTSDKESLLTMRRSFHTLKGSGRIVGAMNLGEFAWAVENLLNRVIDGTVAASPEVFALLSDVEQILPTLVTESTQLGASQTDVSTLSERAFALAAGEDANRETDSDELRVVAGTATKVDAAPDSDPADSLTLDLVDEGDESGADDPLRLDLSDDAPQSEDDAEHSGDAAPAAPEHTPDESILTAAEVQDSEFLPMEGEGTNSNDTSLNAVFVAEANGHLNALESFIKRCAVTVGGCAMEAGVRRAMHTLCGSARTAGIKSMADLAEALEGYSEVLQNQQRRTDGHALDLLNRSHGMLMRLAHSIDEAEADSSAWHVLRDEIAQECEVLADPPVADSREPDAAVAHDVFDPELLDIFLDEAKELLDAFESEYGDWVSASDDKQVVAQLQRTLHTMKGGARLAGVTGVGDLSHALESVFESVVEGRIEGAVELQGLVRHASDALAQDIEQLLRGNVPAGHSAMVERLEAAARGRAWDEIAATDALIQSGQVVSERLAAHPSDGGVAWSSDQGVGRQSSDETGEDSIALSESELLSDSVLLGDSSSMLAEPADEEADGGPSSVVPFPGASLLNEDSDGFVPRKPLPEEPATTAPGSERVRVESAALDQMVNNAGEVSIYRARIEQQNGSIAFNLGELQQTIDRLRSQLRGLENETEAQILSRHERDSETRADFDPLELDRYSTIQQLSRALSETVEDLSNLGQSLNDLSRDTDTLLLQQARVTTDLQDGLLRTRMVRFASRAPRLERVVRQTAHSVGKQANLEVVGGEEDMDRAILERMMGPLEHLLRNAVSHGIEDADTRKAADKPAEGRITLALTREGNDVVLSLSDDGAGLDLGRIRAKAQERGLIEPGAQLNDGDLSQLILEPGFSTAEELSQVSGRGVGMDVVLTEVKQLGGALDIDSQLGAGTRFSIRLPFTLAITDALLVTVGEDYYAIPHSSMDGVVRVGVDELRNIYAGKQDFYSHGGQDHTVRYLGSMLGVSTPQIAEGARWMPLLLVHSGDHHVAIQVDGLLGNREIVIKSVGAQLSGVRWFTGATIMADGQIALILDTSSLVRMDSAHQPVVDEESTASAHKGVSVMVVDDSITVRKVTSRLLERHNMQVITAKDGVDAVTVLQETHPDVMLLDIEMPRMDGFELARHMRSTPELDDIPIIMITSRTGDKHRDRASELGVQRYLGKPYQEDELLENIYTVLADAAL